MALRSRNKRSKNFEKRPKSSPKNSLMKKIALPENSTANILPFNASSVIHRARRSPVYGATRSDTLECTPVTISFGGRAMP